ncbi:hypothetical protein EXIGLDRAFT_845216 [Exidia glandulosa HHB12029]|uniref:Uncharacterized protein n=1 Tax=Exidia glandulosa HHB12029 TaxID=1314781 RepID=A0A165BKM9_EXIGL|nr:hypothetical protein EXIGLDRAFT_845216 [Exidia glandulosa HHB12029]
MVLTVRRDRSWDVDAPTYMPRKRFPRPEPSRVALESRSASSRARAQTTADVIDLSTTAVESESSVVGDSDVAGPPPPPPPTVLSSQPNTSAPPHSQSSQMPPPSLFPSSLLGDESLDTFDDELPLQVPDVAPTPTPRPGLVDLPEIRDEDEPVHVEEAVEAVGSEHVPVAGPSNNGVTAQVVLKIRVPSHTDHLAVWDAQPGSFITIECDVLFENENYDRPTDFLADWELTNVGVRIFTVASPCPDGRSYIRSKKHKDYEDFTSMWGARRTTPPTKIELKGTFHLRRIGTVRIHIPVSLFDVARDRVFVLNAHVECWDRRGGGSWMEGGTRMRLESENVRFSISVLRRGIDMAP